MFNLDDFGQQLTILNYFAAPMLNYNYCGIFAARRYASAVYAVMCLSVHLSDKSLSSTKMAKPRFT